jgi:hypothetical protein
VIGASDPAQDPVATPPREAVQRWRLVLARTPVDAELAQRALLAGWKDALARCGLPVAGLDARPPRARFAVGAPLAAGVAGERELLDFSLVERLPRWRVREALEPVMPAGHRLVDLVDVWLGEPPLPGQVVASVYRAELLEPVDAARARELVGAMLAADTLPRTRRRGEGSVAYDLRPFLDQLEWPPGPEAPGGTLRMTLRHDPEKGLGRPDEVLAELGERLGRGTAPAARLVRERLVLAAERRQDRPQAASAATRRGRK